jgi:YCII-related domain
MAGVAMKGKPMVMDGPFAETRELIAGFRMIQVKSNAEAIEWVKRWPALDGHGEVEIEIRQVFEADDFGPELTPEIREQKQRLRAQAAELIADPDEKAAAEARNGLRQIDQVDPGLPAQSAPLRVSRSVLLYPTNFFTTFPSTSVSRKSRPK